MTPQERLQQDFGLDFDFRVSLEELRQFYSNNGYCLDEEGKLKGITACENDLTSLKIPNDPFYAGLQYLNLGDNKSLKSIIFEGPLSKLKHLDASDSGLQEIVFPAGFSDLEWLDLSRNQLTAFNSEGSFPRLTYIDFTKNQLERLDLDAKSLTHLYLNDNQLKQLQFSRIPLQLQFLQIDNNQLEQLPDHFLLLDNLKVLYLYGNPLEGIPREVIESGEKYNAVKEIQSYLQSIEKSGGKKTYLYQAKMVLVGNGMVGKTSIRKKLVNKAAPLPKEEERTEGLDVDQYTIPQLEPSLTGLDVPIDFQLNIWDFGGQGKYREIQQLFCSRKTLYLFVTACDDLPQNEDYVNFDYWLSMINAYSYDETDKSLSPVIHVVNKIDKEEQLIDEPDRKKNFPNVEKFVKISCKTMERFEELKKSIRAVLPKVNKDVFTDGFATNWMEVKTELESIREENHISFERYLTIAESHQLDETEAKSWLRILHRIGIVIYFGENKDLKNWIILNPQWVKGALFKLLDSPLLKKDGVLNPTFFPFIWPNPQFKPEEHEKLLALMKAYELCYEQMDNHGQVEYIVPALLPRNTPIIPNHLKAWNYELKFDYTPFYPAGMVNKLMVRLNRFIYKKLKWKNNVILHHPGTNTYAHLWEAWDEKAIYLNLIGEEVALFYALISAELSSLTDNLKKTRYMAYLDFSVFVKHNDEWDKEETLKKFNVNRFSFLWAETKKEGSIRKKEIYQQSKGPKVFISYARKVDSRYSKAFFEGIKAHSDWQVFTDRQIVIGEDWHNRLQKEVQECDFAIFLLSAYFFNSDYIKNHEFKHFIERNATNGFPFFSILLSDCDYSKWEEIAKRQIFVAEGQDYDLAKTHRDKMINFDLLARFDSDGELIPNPYLNTYYKNFVQTVNTALGR